MLPIAEREAFQKNPVGPPKLGDPGALRTSSDRLRSARRGVSALETGFCFEILTSSVISPIPARASEVYALCDTQCLHPHWQRYPS